MLYSLLYAIRLQTLLGGHVIQPVVSIAGRVNVCIVLPCDGLPLPPCLTQNVSVVGVIH